MKLRDILRAATPGFLLGFYRNRKKEQQRKALEAQRSSGQVWSKADLLNQLKSIGIEKGDTLLVHSSLSKIGYIENGPKDLVDALLEAVGPTGNILMPNSPNASFQLDYVRSLKVFDAANDASKLGAITEYFRKLPEAKRSKHPTEPVSCIGPDAEYFTGSHFGNLTPYNENSPFYKVSERKGKILYIGVTLDNAGTNLHTLEDAVEDFKYPVYYAEEFPVKVKFEDGTIREMKTKVHNPVWSKKRKCDGLLPMFEAKGVLQKVKIGHAPTLLFDADKMLKVMISEYNEHGITMYTPEADGAR